MRWNEISSTADQMNGDYFDRVADAWAGILGGTIRLIRRHDGVGSLVLHVIMQLHGQDITLVLMLDWRSAEPQAPQTHVIMGEDGGPELSYGAVPLDPDPQRYVESLCNKQFHQDLIEYLEST